MCFFFKAGIHFFLCRVNAGALRFHHLVVLQLYVVLTAAAMRACVILQRKQLYRGVNSVFNISVCGARMHDLRMELNDVLGLRCSTYIRVVLGS
jgi:hypothetical protein